MLSCVLRMALPNTRHFVDQPEATMKQICENLQLEYDPTFMKK